jgi:hypothetical protein
MNMLDDLLDDAAADLQRVVARVPIPTSFDVDGLGVGGRDRRSGSGRPTAMRFRRILVTSAAAALVVGGLIWIERRPTDSPSDTPPLSTSTSPTTTPLFDAAHVPLQLTPAPAGYALVGQFVRPAGVMRLRSAVFVQRDAQGAIVGRVLARLGDLSLIGTSEGTSQPGFYQQPITPPPNLTTATTGSLYIEQDSRVIHVQFPLGDLGNLMLDSYHLDAATDLATAAQMQQIVAALQISASGDITVPGSLPDGWGLATAGVEPEVAIQRFEQNFEVDTPDGGNRILLYNLMTADAGIPYWEMDETLEPLEVRGHAGFVSTHTQVAPPAGLPNVAGSALARTTLIWLEAPAHWVILRGEGMTTDQLVAIANQLTAASSGEWRAPGAPIPTTTTAYSGPASS